MGIDRKYNGGGGLGGKHFSKTFSIFYMLDKSFQPIFFNRYLSNEKMAFVDKSRIEPTIFLIEKISFSLKLFSGHFYGQSFIKTVRGPLGAWVRGGTYPQSQCCGVGMCDPHTLSSIPFFASIANPM